MSQPGRKRRERRLRDYTLLVVEARLLGAKGVSVVKQPTKKQKELLERWIHSKRNNTFIFDPKYKDGTYTSRPTP